MGLLCKRLWVFIRKQYLISNGFLWCLGARAYAEADAFSWWQHGGSGRRSWRCGRWGSVPSSNFSTAASNARQHLPSNAAVPSGMFQSAHQFKGIMEGRPIEHNIIWVSQNPSASFTNASPQGQSSAYSSYKWTQVAKGVLIYFRRVFASLFSETNNMKWHQLLAKN